MAAFALHWIAGVMAALTLGRRTLARVAISAVVGPAAGLAVFLLAR